MTTNKVSINKSESTILQVIAPNFANNKEFPNITRYPSGRTIGYINVLDTSYYVQIISSTTLGDGRRNLTLVPIIAWSKETINMINEQISHIPIEVYYLAEPKALSVAAKIEFNVGFGSNVLNLSLPI